MNLMLIIPAAITTLALIAHTLIGTQEALSTSPQKIEYITTKDIVCRVNPRCKA